MDKKKKKVFNSQLFYIAGNYLKTDAENKAYNYSQRTKHMLLQLNTFLCRRREAILTRLAFHMQLH